jgi:hypothetical protein
MKSIPVSIAGQSYRGSDVRKRAKVAESNRNAARIEDHINRDLERLPQHSVAVYDSAFIASELGEDNALVHGIVHATDGEPTESPLRRATSGAPWQH